MTDENKDMIPEEEDNIVELTDEDGNEPEGDDGEVVILQIEQDENGEDIYVSVDDDAVSQAVFEKFLEAMDAEDEE